MTGSIIRSRASELKVTARQNCKLTSAGTKRRSACRRVCLRSLPRRNVLLIGDAQFVNWIASGLRAEAVPTSGLMAAFCTGAQMSIASSNRTFGSPEERAAPLRRVPYETPRPAGWQRAEVKEN